MHLFKKILLTFSLLFVVSCSSSYEQLSKGDFNPPNKLSKYLFESYKEKADFEAKKMHDWNSAKLYSEKALLASIGEEVLPQDNAYWDIPSSRRLKLLKGYDNLMSIYADAILLDPLNLANAISSLDCWSEQEEEGWQIWDINKCRDDFLTSLHFLYDSISNAKKNYINNKKDLTVDSASIITKDIEENILQIIYFDFDRSNLTSVSIKEIKIFIEKNKKNIDKFLITGHTDRLGSKKYNQILSIQRADSVKKILIDAGIKSNNIKIIGKGEEQLNVITPDEMAHPANRRAEISPLN